MKTNLIILGENSQINKSVGQVLAEMLELNYLDFDGYCDYINLVSRDKVIQIYGKRKYNELQKETLPQMRDFCDSVIAFDEKVSRLPSVYNVVNKTAFIVCIANKDKEKYAKYADIWITLNKKSKKVLINEIIRKLGDVQ